MDVATYKCKSDSANCQTHTQDFRGSVGRQRIRMAKIEKESHPHASQRLQSSYTLPLISISRLAIQTSTLYETATETTLPMGSQDNRRKTQERVKFGVEPGRRREPHALPSTLGTVRAKLSLNTHGPLSAWIGQPRTVPHQIRPVGRASVLPTYHPHMGYKHSLVSST
ncbi:hypothetical protein DY000_02045412 [Brassica cretica]|uniref:Uncharacterized protein n=1 Tax=Brassica cretica TaxID=69181 RepID=A0ABQ7F0U4_BRACR|nr:hypothetical protein DY000_02045412 [Brassica cretica]